MADDIVTRLRELGRYVNTEGGRWFEPITTEAADEIERLRADRDRWRTDMGQLSAVLIALGVELQEQADNSNA